jgi:hypothetical protein
MEQDNSFSDEFIRSLLLNLEHSDFAQFMDLSYHVLMQSPIAVLKNSDSTESKINSMDNLIKYFEDLEEYEKCNNLQKLKSMLFLDMSIGDDDL